jgi:hypothetical protein
VRLFLLNASSARRIEVAFADLVAQRASAFLLKTDPFFMTERDQLVALDALPPVMTNWPATISPLCALRQPLYGGFNDSGP